MYINIGANQSPWFRYWLIQSLPPNRDKLFALGHMYQVIDRQCIRAHTAESKLQMHSHEHSVRKRYPIIYIICNIWHLIRKMETPAFIYWRDKRGSRQVNITVHRLVVHTCILSYSYSKIGCSIPCIIFHIIYSMCDVCVWNSYYEYM